MELSILINCELLLLLICSEWNEGKYKWNKKFK